MTDIIDFDNALVIGGSGMIGVHINVKYKPTSKEVNILDYYSIKQYLSKHKEISCIINLAALNLRNSEEDPVKSIHVNIDGTTNLLMIAKKFNLPFILLSSGAVFSSKQNNKKIFIETSKTSPNCFYGVTKSSSEKISLLYEKCIVIRTGWVFGGTQQNHNKYVELFINNLLTNTPIYANSNFYGSPTYVSDLVEKIKYIVTNKMYGVHHVVNADIASGYDVAKEISKLLGKSTDLIFPTSCEKVPNAGPNRSLSEILETSYEYNKMRSWREALSEYIDKYLISRQMSVDVKKIDNDIWKNRDKCRLCDSAYLKTFFKLEHSPQANHFVEKPVDQQLIPLDVCICNNCNHIQLLQILDKSYQYSNYLYTTSASKPMVSHVTSNIEIFLKSNNIQKTDKILEIGANDGTGIKYLLDNEYVNAIGIDPAVNINKFHNLPIICDFFGPNIFNYDNISTNSFKLIYAFHCCAHIENIQEIFETIYKLLTEDGVFVMEVGYFYEVYRQHAFDVIYHEHIDYHTCKSMRIFCLKNNLKLFDVKMNKIQSGSIQFYISKNMGIEINDSVEKTIQKEEDAKLFDIDSLLNWKNKIILNSRDLGYLINCFISEGKVIFGYGASAKSTTFIHQYKLSNSTIKYIIDDSHLKQNLFTPGSHIPIVSMDILNVEKCDYIIILSWNYTDEILLKLHDYISCGLRVIVPFPNITII